MLHFGILLTDPNGHGCQWQDFSQLDILFNATPEYLHMLDTGSYPSCDDHSAPKHDKDPHVGVPVKFHYIAEKVGKPAAITSGIHIMTTDSYHSCPKLDYLWIPGAPPAYKPSEDELEFIRKRWGEVKTLFCVCTGAFVLGASGVADGYNATGNRGVIDMLKKQYPKVKWDGSRRWVVDAGGKLWTSGGAQTGVDMLGTFMGQHFDPAVVKRALGVGDTELRSQIYPD